MRNARSADCSAWASSTSAVIASCATSVVGVSVDKHAGDAAERRKRLIEKCDQYREIGPLDDGFQYFWIKDRGALSATDLRIIADELDARNKDLERQLEKDLREH